MHFSFTTDFEREFKPQTTYRILALLKNPLKQEKHPYKWSTFKYNSINNGSSQNIVASKCGPIVRVEKQAIS